LLKQHQPERHHSGNKNFFAHNENSFENCFSPPDLTGLFYDEFGFRTVIMDRKLHCSVECDYQTTLGEFTELDFMKRIAVELRVKWWKEPAFIKMFLYCDGSCLFASP
jgi:hypothetical protein